MQPVAWSGAPAVGLPAWAKVLAFQLLAAALILSPAKQSDVFAVALLCLWVPVHLHLSRHAGSELRVIIGALLLGPCCDLLLMRLGLINYNGVSLAAGLPPLWIYAMWVNFALLFHHSLSILSRRRWLSIPIALLSAPCAYLSGSALGAASLAQPTWLALLIVAQCWMLILPVLARLSAPPKR